MTETDEEIRGSRFEFDGQEACFVKLRKDDPSPTTTHQVKEGSPRANLDGSFKVEYLDFFRWRIGRARQAKGEENKIILNCPQLEILLSQWDDFPLLVRVTMADTLPLR